MKVGANGGHRLRALVLYCFRILLVYCVLLGFLHIISEAVFGGSEFYRMVWGICHIAWGFQGWVSFAIIITKPDIRKIVGNLIAGRSCRRSSSRRMTFFPVAVFDYLSDNENESTYPQNEPTDPP